MLRLSLEAIRVRQWAKNLLVFVPAVMAHRLLDPGPMGRAALAFLALSLAASATYVLNDLRDLEADRRHPDKRRRPFAAGELPPGVGAFLIPLLAVGGAALAAAVSPELLVVVLVYLALTTAYTLALKRVVLLDVVILAALYTLRVIGGSAATGIVSSEWLLAFSTFLFFSLASVKRYAELRAAEGAGDPRQPLLGRGWRPSDLPLILTMGVAAGHLAVLVLAMYIAGPAVSELYRRPRFIWLICPLLLYWISRVWLLAQRGELHDDPLSFAFRDGATWAVAAATAAVLLLGTGSL